MGSPDVFPAKCLCPDLLPLVTGLSAKASDGPLGWLRVLFMICPPLSGQSFNILIPDVVQPGLRSLSWLLTTDHKQGTWGPKKCRGFMLKCSKLLKVWQIAKTPITWKLETAHLLHARTIQAGWDEMHQRHLLNRRSVKCDVLKSARQATFVQTVRIQRKTNVMTLCNWDQSRKKSMRPCITPAESKSCLLEVRNLKETEHICLDRTEPWSCLLHEVSLKK